MRTLQFKITVILICVFTYSSYAQRLDKKYTEKFIVNPDVTIDINTRYVDIEIETWNKNEVVIEAFMKVEGESDQKIIDDYFERWNFEALGNKSNVKISSKSSNYIDISSFDFDKPNYEMLVTDRLREMPEIQQFVMPEISVYSLELLDSFNFPRLLMPVMPDIEPSIFDLSDTHYNILMMEKFDFKKHKKDKNYLKKWKEKNKEALKGYNIKIGRNSISISNNDGASKEELERRQKKFEVKIKEQHKRFEKRLEEQHERLLGKQLEYAKKSKERAKERRLVLLKREELHEKRVKELHERREKVNSILEKREKVKIKRIIKIKVPKNAKFNMNVKYGSMSFPN